MIVRLKDVEIKGELKGTLEVTHGGGLVIAKQFTKQFNKRYT